MTSKNDNEKTPLEEARDDFAEKISVAGWKEAVTEPIRLFRYVYRISLIAFSIICVYLLALGFSKYLKSGYTDEITDFSAVPSIPMPNVTACAQVYFNQTFVKEIVSIPSSVLAEIKKSYPKDKAYATPLDKFYHQLTIFLSMMMRPSWFTQDEMAWFERVIKANPPVANYTNFLSRAVAPCEKMFKRCWVNGVEFDCCSKAVRSYDDDGICYILALNMDSDNAAPNKRTIHQHRSGPAGGLTIEASLPLRDFPWFEDDAQNGFRIIVGPVPFSFSSSPVLAPDLSETFVKVTPQIRNLAPAQGCAEHGQMTMSGGEFMYHDPEGFSCIIRELSNVAYKYAQCRFPTYFFVPNETTACEPRVNVILAAVFAFGFSSLESIAGEKGQLAVKRMESDLHLALSGRARCASHCRYWTYDSKASFFYLDRDPLPNQTMYSKIHVYYGELAYRQYEQVKELPIYMALCDLGNIFGLYWGMSVVSFFHVIYYVAVYVRAWRKWGVRKERVQDIRIRTTAV